MKKYALSDEMREVFGIVYKLDPMISKLCTDALDEIAKTQNIKVPDIFYRMKIVKASRSKYDAIVFEVPNAENECDCNYVAIIRTKDRIVRYFTSELYKSDNFFALGEFFKDGRQPKNIIITDISSFFKAIDSCVY